MQIEAATEEMLADHWPLVRRLANALVDKKMLPWRRVRGVLYKA
jgi:hypothetical protein